ncbi:MAG: hypothetical protein R3B70_02895 [Polyangiaceae bacterium]
MINAYVVVGFLLASAATTTLLEVSKSLHWIENLSIVALVMMSLAVWSGLEERRRWAVPLELIKLTGAVALAVWFLRAHPLKLPLIAASVAVAAGLGVWVLRCGKAASEAPAHPADTPVPDSPPAAMAPADHPAGTPAAS